MFARSIAVLLVLVLVGPSLVTATCELTCAMASHHREAPSSSEAPCHEHQGSAPDRAVSANPSALCHDSGALPSAVVDAWLNTAAIATLPAATIVIAPPPAVQTTLRALDRSALSDPRPAHRPIRV